MNTNIEEQITLEYHGTSVELGRMNSYDVASYIYAFSDFLGIISRTKYGEKIELRTEIQGFRKNSFDIDFVLYLGGMSITLLSSTPLTAKELIILIKDSIKAWIHLDGKPPQEIIQNNNSNIIDIKNQNGQIIYCNADVINVITDIKAGKAVEQFIKKPLESGLTHLHIKSKTYDEVAKIEDKQAASFIPVDIEKPLYEQEMQMNLLIESPTFKEGNKWKFFDGQNSFYADILDEDFIKNVDSGNERFGKGDTLTVILKFRQMGSLGKLNLERTIIKVLKHEEGIKPDKLF